MYKKRSETTPVMKPSKNEPDLGTREMKKILEKIAQIRKNDKSSTFNPGEAVQALDEIHSDLRKCYIAQETLNKVSDILAQKPKPTNPVDSTKPAQNHLKANANVKTGQSSPKPDATSRSRAGATMVTRQNQRDGSSNSNTSRPDILQEIISLIKTKHDLEKGLSGILQTLKPSTDQRTLLANNTPGMSVDSKAVLNEINQILMQTRKQEVESEKDKKETETKMKVLAKTNEKDSKAKQIEIEQLNLDVKEFKEMVKQWRPDIYETATKAFGRNKKGSLLNCLHDLIITEVKGVVEIKEENKRTNEEKVKAEACVAEFIDFVEKKTGRIVEKKSADTLEPNFKEMLKNLKNHIEEHQVELSSLQASVGFVLKTSTDASTYMKQALRLTTTTERLDLLKYTGIDNKIKTIHMQIQEMTDTYAELKSQEANLRKEIRESQKNIQAKTTECDNLQLRLSKIAGAKLTDGNPSITNLSDPNRPMKLGDKFSELYDNEWTDLLDHFIKKMKGKEDQVIQNIFYILQICYKACQQKASTKVTEAKEYARKAAAVILMDEKHPEIDKVLEEYTNDNRQLMEARRRSGDQVAALLAKELPKDPAFLKLTKDYKTDKAVIEKIVQTSFFKSCVNICWKMVIQDPPMFLHPGVKKGGTFDKSVYREYTSSGQKVVFTVWPALYLHEGGPLLQKGVVKVE